MIARFVEFPQEEQYKGIYVRKIERRGDCQELLLSQKQEIEGWQFVSGERITMCEDDGHLYLHRFRVKKRFLAGVELPRYACVTKEINGILTYETGTEKCALHGVYFSNATLRISSDRQHVISFSGRLRQ